MITTMIVHPRFQQVWPYAADHFVTLLEAGGDQVDVIRIAPDDRRFVGQLVLQPGMVERLICLGAPVSTQCLGTFKALKDLVYESPTGRRFPANLRHLLSEAGVTLYEHQTEGVWGQSVAEFALALMICGLRRIPQLHVSIVEGHADWEYEPEDLNGRLRGSQFGDDSRFVNGTVKGKRVRIVGAGNIGGRVARFATELGADVAVWDPFASEPCFHLANARKEWSLERLVADADIFLPLLPLTAETHGIVTARHVDLLPKGALVVMVTRAHVCDTMALRRRILADELAIAADVFDTEPLSPTDLLIGRHNVIHTPHVAGRTKHANEQFAASLVSQFK